MGDWINKQYVFDKEIINGCNNYVYFMKCVVFFTNELSLTADIAANYITRIWKIISPLAKPPIIKSRSFLEQGVTISSKCNELTIVEIMLHLPNWSSKIFNHIQKKPDNQTVPNK